MKHDKRLNIENLETELFIEELGQVYGGNTSSTSLAGSEEPGWDDTPSQPVFFTPSNINIEELLGRYRRSYPGLPSNPEQPVTTYALGEE